MTYKPGDLVTVRLDADCARYLNNGARLDVSRSQIISHQPAPEPSVFYVNVYPSCHASAFSTEENANENADNESRIALFKITHTAGKQPSIEEVII